MIKRTLLMSVVALFCQVQPVGTGEVWTERSLGLTMSLPDGFRLVTLPDLTSRMSHDPSRFLMAAQMGTQQFGIIGLASNITPNVPPYSSPQAFLHAIVLTNQAQGIKIEQEDSIQVAPGLKLQELVYTITGKGEYQPEYDAAVVAEWKGMSLSFKINAPKKDVRLMMLHAVETIRPMKGT